MSNLFGNLNDDPRIQRQALMGKYSAARVNLLLLIIFSVLNIFTLIVGVGSYFLFSARIPYFMIDLAKMLSGLYPDEYYKDYPDMVFLDKSVYIISILCAVIIIGVYFICWLLSKGGKVKWLRFALWLTVIDTAVLFLTGGLSALIDLALHGWVIYILFAGIKAHAGIRALPKENMIEAEFTELQSDEQQIYPPIDEPREDN